YHGRQVGRYVEADVDRPVRRADESQRARLLHHLAELLPRALRSAHLDELPQPLNDGAGALDLRDRALRSFERASRLGPAGLFQHPADRVQVVHRRAERLAELVGEGRRHGAHSADSRHLDQLRLQLVQALFDFLTLGNIAYEAREHASTTQAHLADRKLHRKGRAVLALADDDTTDADDPFLARFKIAADIAVMSLPVGRRHEHPNVLADDFVRPIAEQTADR